MAEDVDDSQKTEDPSGRKLARARDKGQVVHSREVNNWFIVGTGLGLVLLFGPPAARSIGQSLYRYVAMQQQIGIGQLGPALEATLGQIGTVLLAPLALLMVAALAGPLVQTGFVFAPGRVTPDINNISPMRGVSRIFSMRGMVEFGKTLAKLAVVIAVAISLLKPEIDRMPMIVGMDAADLLGELQRLIIRLGFGVFAILTLI